YPLAVLGKIDPAAPCIHEDFPVRACRLESDGITVLPAEAHRAVVGGLVVITAEKSDGQWTRDREIGHLVIHLASGHIHWLANGAFIAIYGSSAALIRILPDLNCAREDRCAARSQA